MMKMMFDKMTRYMGRRKKYKVGDRIFFEYYDGENYIEIYLK